MTVHDRIEINPKIMLLTRVVTLQSMQVRRSAKRSDKKDSRHAEVSAMELAA